MQKDDVIYRQAAIDAIIEDKICDDSLKIMTALGEGDKAETLNMTCDRHAKMLMSLPSAQPEQKTATWLIRKWGDDAKCSNCGKTFSDVYDMDNHDRFCRFCGSKMIGVKGTHDK